MAVRALIIAIESYQKAQGGGMAKSLPGTLQAGLGFRTWLLEKWRAEGRSESDTQLLFCSEPPRPDGTPATRKDILRALLKLKRDGQGATEELYVFFSGHGFSFVEKVGSRADVIIASDFEQPDLSGDCCLNLDLIITWLRYHLGPGRHYYFVDACRNKLDGTRITVGSLPPMDPQASEESSTFLLQSTVDGATAPVRGPFPAALMDGLRGRGRSKVWKPQVNDAMFVQYDSLRSYLKALLSKHQPIDHKTSGPEGESDAVLASIRPVPRFKCTIEVGNASGQDQGQLLLKRGRGDLTSRPLQVPSMELELEPDDYAVSVRLDNAAVDPANLVAIDLYEDRKLVFNKVAGTTPGLESIGDMPGAALEAAVEGTVDVMVPAHATFSLRNVNTGEEQLFNASERINVPQGRYLATLRSRNNLVVKRQEMDVTSGGNVSLNLTEWRSSAPHIAIASKLPTQNGAVDFSESLGGPVTDTDLDLWLALLGAGRILGSRGDYSKLAHFPLRDFAGEKKGASPIYVLAGFEQPDTGLMVGLSQDADVAWIDAVEPPDMRGIREAYLAARPGSQLVSFRIADQPPYTVATLASPNRGMLITLTPDDEGNPRLSQYLLPMGHLLNELAPEVKRRLQWRSHLQDVRFIAQASRAFRKRRDLSKQVSAGELSELLYAKWLDPIASSLAGYEALRRGRKTKMREMVENMNRFFPDVPDSAALAKLSGKTGIRRKGIPLFLDGLRAFPNYAKWLPLPASHLDFTSPWTAWRAAVKS